MTTTAQETTRAPGPSAAGQAANLLRGAEAWLDARGKVAWIAAMVLGFIVFWPVGLAILFYMIATSRFSGGCSRNRRHDGFRSASAAGSSGNSAFDAYREETLRRLEEEQQAFEAFLKRLRDARDKAEFDQFMEERARKLAEAAADNEAGPAGN